MRTRYRGSDTLLPVRGRKLSTIPQPCSRRVRSDTLLPARGRKPLDLLPFEIVVIKFRYPSPREGTETKSVVDYDSAYEMFRYLAPREGTETGYGLLFDCVLFGSDTLLPARGLIYILLSPHKKPTCNACGLLLFYQRSLTTFTRIFDLPHDG